MEALKELNALAEIAKKHIKDYEKLTQDEKQQGNNFYKWLKQELNQGDSYKKLNLDLQKYLQDTLNSNWHRKEYAGIKAKTAWCTNYDYHKYSNQLLARKDFDLYAKMDANANWLIIFNIKSPTLVKQFQAYKKLASSKENKLTINLNMDYVPINKQTAINTPFGQMGVVATLENLPFKQMKNDHLVALRLNMNPYFAKSLTKAGYTVTKSNNLLHFDLAK